MQNLAELFSPKGDSIDIAGVGSLAKICKFNPQKKDKFFSGLELADDLVDDQSTTLYTKGTSITVDRVQRLLNLSENRPDHVMNFKIKRSPGLIANFKTDILTKVQKLTEFKKKYKVYAELIGSIAQDIQVVIEEILSDENTILTIYKMKFAAEASENKTAALFFNHTISVVLFSYAVAISPELKNTLNFSKNDLKDLLKVAFFHNIGALTNVETFVYLAAPDKKMHYQEGNKNSGSMLGDLQLSSEIMDAIRFASEHPFEMCAFVERTDKKECRFADIVVAADIYSQLEVGLFGTHFKPSKIIDTMNLMARDHQLNQNVVKSLSFGLNLKDVFDFYVEMDRLQNLCTVQGGKHAWPYPMTGVKSPTPLYLPEGH